MTNNIQQYHQADDEIDLIELIRVLWKNKLQIIAVTAITTILAAAYAFTAKQQWTSKTTVVAPTLSDMGEYLAIRREYNRILQTEAIDPNALSANLFANFSQLARSTDVRNEFFAQSDIYKQLTEGKDEFGKIIALSSLSNQTTKFIIPDAKKEPNTIGYKISFFAETPTEAKKTLEAFVNFVDAETLKIELDSFLINFENTLKTLRYEKFVHDENVNLLQKVQLDYLNKAYETADRAGVEDYYKFFLNDNVSQDVTQQAQTQAQAQAQAQVSLVDSQLFNSNYLFMLGKKYLKAQIEALTEKGKIYSTRYYQIDSQVKQLEALLEQAKQIKAQTYHYHASPDYPVRRDKPKKAIILVLGMFLGFCLSIVWIILLSLFKNSSIKKNIN
ncbi:LPS O-antigen chain length determinant protein WzzB [Suttonella indologenes]|uniref:Lipopolysaccharide biosynthesis protein wzzE n=1 Tax=Suttonella indologenes TaxID=13276 RepID=A0A380MZA8_9GAMM|nr:Wzz/FepE/Etk N-terminal domain-containing protein [Suttonella indologenes]SUO97895.1 Lipopolysaccharide biosynthesis protein wzzE [Suttonella indologenes]